MPEQELCDSICEEARQRGLIDWIDVSASDDSVGVQTYSRERIGADGTVPPAAGTPTMQTGWEAYPEALEHTVCLAAAIALTKGGELLTAMVRFARLMHARRLST